MSQGKLNTLEQGISQQGMVPSGSTPLTPVNTNFGQPAGAVQSGAPQNTSLNSTYLQAINSAPSQPWINNPGTLQQQAEAAQVNPQSNLITPQQQAQQQQAQAGMANLGQVMNQQQQYLGTASGPVAPGGTL